MLVFAVTIALALAAVARARLNIRRQGPGGPDDFARFPAPRPPFADSPPSPLFPGPGSPFAGGAQPPFSLPKALPGGGRFPVFAAKGDDGDDDKSSKSKDSDDKDSGSKKNSSNDDDDDSKSSDSSDDDDDKSDDDDDKSDDDGGSKSSKDKSKSSSSSSSSGKSSSSKSKGSGDDDDDSSSGKKSSSSGSKGSSSKDDKSSSSDSRKDGPTASDDRKPVIPTLPVTGGRDGGGEKSTSQTSSATTAPTQTRPTSSNSRASTSSSSTSLTNSGSELELSSPTSLSSGSVRPPQRTFPLAAAGVIGAVSSFLVVSAIIWGLWLGLRRRRKRRVRHLTAEHGPRDSPGWDFKAPPSDASPRILTLPSFPSMTVTDSTRESEGVPFWLRAAELDVPYQMPLGSRSQYPFAHAHESSAQSYSVSSVTVRPGANRV